MDFVWNEAQWVAAGSVHKNLSSSPLISEISGGYHMLPDLSEAGLATIEWIRPA
jgi:hypothetical protein